MGKAYVPGPGPRGPEVEDTRVLPRVVGREPVSCGDPTGREARQPESHTNFRGQHGLGSEQLLQPYHTWGCLGFRGKGLTMAGGCTLRLPVTQGASDWEGSPPDHSSGDLGLAGTTRIAEPGLRPRWGCAWRGLWFPAQEWGACWLLWGCRMLRPLCVSTIIATWGLGIGGPIRLSPAFTTGVRTPKSR